MASRDVLDQATERLDEMPLVQAEGSPLAAESFRETPLLRAILDSSPDGVMMIDPVTLSLVGVNKEACRSLDRSPDDLLGCGIRQIAPGVSAEALARQYDEVIHNPEEPRTIDVVQRRSDGSEFAARWHLGGLQTEDGPLLIVYARPLASQSSAAWGESLGGLLLTDLGHDPLTRLPNRRLFEKRLERSLKLAHRCRDYAFAVLFVDLNGFKAVNDSLGHVEGDRLLCEVARRLSRCVRPEDMVARLGGDEFTVLVENLRQDADALCVAERIEAQLKPPIHLPGREATVSAAIGIARSSRSYTRPESILRSADRAMYLAKATGRSPCVFSEG